MPLKAHDERLLVLTRSLWEPGGPCTKSMAVSESRMERVNKHKGSVELLYSRHQNVTSGHTESRCVEYQCLLALSISPGACVKWSEKYKYLDFKQRRL